MLEKQQRSKEELLTNVFLCLIHLATYSHFPAGQQQVSDVGEELCVDQAPEAGGMAWLRAVELQQAGAQCQDETGLHIGVAQHKVRSHVALPGIVEACPCDALCSNAHVTLPVHVARVLPTQNQGDWGQRASRSLHHLLTSRTAACKPNQSQSSSDQQGQEFVETLDYYSKFLIVSTSESKPVGFCS